MEDEIWTTKDGRKIKVGDMDEQHVRNTLRLILRRRREALKALDLAPGTSAMIARLIRPHLKKMDAVERARLAAEEQQLHEDIMNDIGEDRKWGSD